MQLLPQLNKIIKPGTDDALAKANTMFFTKWIAPTGNDFFVHVDYTIELELIWCFFF